MLNISKVKQNPQLKTLAIDIGGTGVKMIVLDAHGKPVNERLRLPTPNPATPDTVIAQLEEMKSKMPGFDRVSIGFPGVIKQGKTMTAHNLNPTWVDFPLEKTIQERWHVPTRLCNDAAVQGFGAIQGKGLELVLTFGTGLGSSLFIDGRLCPGLELAHHPWRREKTYEDYLGRAGLEKYGRKRWCRLVAKAINQTHDLFNWDRLYLGGGNSPKIEIDMPPDVKVVSNEDGLLGGVALWHNE